jgi:hypothetical protein
MAAYWPPDRSGLSPKHYPILANRVFDNVTAIRFVLKRDPSTG